MKKGHNITLLVTFFSKNYIFAWLFLDFFVPSPGNSLFYDRTRTHNISQGTITRA